MPCTACAFECLKGKECPFTGPYAICPCGVEKYVPTGSPVERISKTQYYLAIARSVAARSTCLRHKYGAVIVKDDEIIATGYNGAPRGEANCCDIGSCQRRHNENGKYETCVAVHAEQNALISAARRDMTGGDIYVAEAGTDTPAEPCAICRRMIVNADIKRIIVY